MSPRSPNVTGSSSSGWIRYLLGRIGSSQARLYALGCATLALLVHSGLREGGIWRYDSLDAGDRSLWANVSDFSVGKEGGFFPLRDLSLSLDRWLATDLFGQRDAVAWAHSVSWILFACAVLLFVYLMYDISKNRGIAGLAGLFMATHPLFVESVAWVSRRGDVLALVFLFAAHLRWRWGRERQQLFPLGALVLLAAATLSRSWACMYGLVLWLDACMAAKEHEESKASDTVALASSRIVPLVLLTVAGVAWEFLRPRNLSGATSVDAMEGATSSLASFVYGLIAPIGRAFETFPTPGVSTILAGLGALALLVSLVLLIARRSRLRAVMALGLCIWVVMWLGHNGWWPSRSPVFMDHYGALALPGLLAVVAALLRGPLAWLGVLAALFFGYTTWQSSPRFRSDEALHTHALENGGGARASVGLGRALMRGTSPDYTRILALSDRAIASTEGGVLVADANALRSHALFGLNRPDEALDAANASVRHAERLSDNVRAVTRRRTQARAHVGRGRSLQAIGDTYSAQDALRRAVLLDPDNALARRAYGSLLASSRDPSAMREAVTHLQRAVDLRPEDAASSMALANAHTLLGDGPAAIAALERAIDRHGRTPDLIYALASVHIQATRDYERARTLLRELQDVAPQHPKGSRLQCDLHMARGRTLFDEARANRKGYAAALEQFDFALEADSKRWEAHMWAGDVRAAEGLYPLAVNRYRDAKQLAPGERWIAGAVARALALESAWLTSRTDDPDELLAAAERLALALDSDATRIDLGFAPLEDELAILREVRAHLRGDDAIVKHLAGGVLCGAACLVAGDERGAVKHILTTLQRMTEHATPAPLVDACLLMRAILYERTANLDEARRDYDMLRDRRSDDVLPKLRLLQIELRAAIARRKTAEGFPDEKETLKKRSEEVARTAARIVAFADRHRASTSAGLLAVEAEMHQRRWTPALARLNDLVERFCEREGKAPAQGCSSVYRGYNMVYLDQYLQNADVSLLRAGHAAVAKALRLDRRDARALLDAARLARIGQNPRQALKLAREAYGYEIKRGGPAARLLADLHVQMGEKALEDGRADIVERAIRDARTVDASHAGSYLLQAKLMLKIRKMTMRERYNRAIQVALRAKELEPTNNKVNSFLAQCYKIKGTEALLAMSGVRRPKKPETAKDWSTLSDDEQERRREAWQTYVTETMPAKRRQWRARAVDYMHQALVLDPRADDAEETRKRVEELKATDPEARFERRQLAQKAYERAESLRSQGKPIRAFHAYERAVELHPRFERAHFRLAQVAYKSIFGLRASDKKERATIDRLITRAFQSLQVLDQIDPFDRFPERWLYRGLLNRWLYRADKQEEAKVAAMRAYTRFLRLKEVARADADKNTEIATAHLRILEESK